MCVSITRTKAESKLGLKVTGIAVEIFIRNHHHHPFTPASKVTYYSQLQKLRARKQRFQET